MRNIYRILSLCVLTAVLWACSKENQPGAGGSGSSSATPTFSLMNSAVTFEGEGGTITVSFKTNQSWTASSDQSWVSLEPASGSASDATQSLTVKASANTGAERSATVTFKAGTLGGTLSVSQKKDPSYVPLTTIAEFKKKSVDKTTWYKITAEIASIANEEYGNLYIYDETGYVYLYGLCEKQVESNDQSFSKLGLKAGDSVTIMTLRSEYNGVVEAGGTTPAWLLSKTAGEYRLGSLASSTKAGWLELPSTSDQDGFDLLMHRFPDGQRSFSAYWDYDNLVSHWVAYPLCVSNIGSGERTESFALDPLLPRDKQAYVSKIYQTGNAGMYDRGHQIPSADRLDWRVNLETFFGTNMTPQDNGLNANAWGVMEGKVRSWARASGTDTLYVVTGCVVKGSTKYVLDNDGKKVTVPTGYYKALLRLSTDKNYSGLAVWFDNEANNASSIQKSMVMSIDELEKKVGLDFFVNLPSDVQKKVEAENPAEATWWWNY
ncbi:MAG: DNA/RNA non-specific endonuclease [Bacteroidales bacterium]|nr:DNA/RNA non-specific endonuclease [Bacteroidales bacterium]